MGCFVGNSVFFDDDGVFMSVLGDNIGDSFESSYIGGVVGIDIMVFGRGVDGNEDNVGFINVFGDIGREGEIGFVGRKVGFVFIG